MNYIKSKTERKMDSKKKRKEDSKIDRKKGRFKDI